LAKFVFLPLLVLLLWTATPIPQPSRSPPVPRHSNSDFSLLVPAFQKKIHSTIPGVRSEETTVVSHLLAFSVLDSHKKRGMNEQTNQAESTVLQPSVEMGVVSSSHSGAHSECVIGTK
jgi:hypothetical protein